MTINALDAADLALLNALQRDADQKLDRLAELSGLSVATVQRRLTRLRRDGPIEGTVAILDPVRLGHPMTFVVSVEMERERPDQIDGFARAASAEAQVQQCHYVTGEGDFVLICVARDMADFEALTRRLFFEQSNVRRFRTSVVMRSYKRTLNVPVCD